MIGQRALIVLALAAGALAGTLYYVGAQRSSVVIAARDIDGTHPLTADDLGIVSVPADAVPPGALADESAALGKLPRAPLWRGQVVLQPALSMDAASFHTGLALPTGMRAVALPVSSAAQAVGGAIVPGARVDVIAVPVAGRAPGGRTAELLLQGAMVLDVRSETGSPYGAAVTKTPVSSVGERIGSVVVAIDSLDEVRFADRIVTSTFILALAGSH
ncbi:MAG: Flp pilus assembly protein CpaB [Chloroflexi bacterium]|nr:MAG: Flp pilus assembly protein CpaB [Chloroflexota bacterium]